MRASTTAIIAEGVAGSTCSSTHEALGRLSTAEHIMFGSDEQLQDDTSSPHREHSDTASRDP